jgi:7,8-dihydroneopterin aldolase/epimerase/oxygenase
MYTVFIRNLVIEGIHGVTHKEKQRGQPFCIEIQAEVDAPLPENDDIGETLDYRTMRDIASRIVREERHALVETIALRIARGIREDPRVCTVSVAVTKLAIWENGTPGVIVRL